MKTLGDAKVKIEATGPEGKEKYKATLFIGEKIQYASSAFDTEQGAMDWATAMAINGGYMEDSNKPKKVASKKPAKKKVTAQG